MMTGHIYVSGLEQTVDWKSDVQISKAASGTAVKLNDSHDLFLSYLTTCSSFITGLVQTNSVYLF